jgi:mRNA-degrading endonuclease RelE of RelBE toxin-antitoxin system
MTRAWLIGFSSHFVEDISTVDKNVQGRILDAITKISTAPVASKGDTVKALTGELKGMWRYRIGDWRLVYLPNARDHSVTLMRFAPRGSVYE